MVFLSVFPSISVSHRAPRQAVPGGIFPSSFRPSERPSISHKVPKTFSPPPFFLLLPSLRQILTLPHWTGWKYGSLLALGKSFKKG